MRSEKGQSLFEVVLALGVITAITVGIVSLAVSSIRNAAFSKNKTLAGSYAQEATEWLRSERDNNFDTFKSHAQAQPVPRYCLTGLNWSRFRSCNASDNIAGTPLFREVTFVTSTTGNIIIKADVKVYWNDSQGDHEVSSITSFTDWRQR